MTHLPAAFTAYTRQLLGEECFKRYLLSFEEEAPVSIRLNPLKAAGMTVPGGEAVPWCPGAYYLPRRPNFTMDPLLHAGCYYVQEAASMFLDEVLRQCMPSGQPLAALDLCAAPGGKSTLLRTALPAGSVLYSNEPVHQRASILAENVEKWGWPDHLVANNFPRDFRKAGMTFDLILCDVPCSGEGMFRKDPATIGEWSPQQVDRCAALQREIVADAWQCLNDGGLLVYSTCTFNTKENEENIRWLLSEYDAEVLPVSVQPEWSITGSLLSGFTAPVCRFIPGTTRSEGLFLCVLRKGGGSHEGRRPGGTKARKRERTQGLHMLAPAMPRADAALPTHTHTPAAPPSPAADLTYQQALSYLRGEALQLPDGTPRGIVEVAFMGHPLGTVKNIGTRANNLYPKPWRIKTTHVASEYEPVLSPAEP